MSSAKELWSRLTTAAENDAELYECLKGLLRVVSEARAGGSVADHVTPGGLTQLVHILQDKRGSQVQLMTVAVIAMVSSSEQLQRILIRKNALKYLSWLYLRPDLNLDPHTIEGQLQGHLFEHLSSLLLFFSAGSPDSKDALIREDVISNMINFLCPLSPLYCYSPAAKTFHKKHTLRKSLKGVITQKDADKCAAFESLRDAYIRAQPEIMRKLRINTDCYEVDLFDNSSGHRVFISDVLVNDGLALKRNSNLNEHETSFGEFRENESESNSTINENNSPRGEEDVVVTAVANGEYFWANLGQDSVEQTKMVQDAIESQPEAERIYLTRPPIAGAFLCGCHESRGCYRAQVIATNDVTARIFTLDYGVVVKISWRELFMPTAAMNLGKIPPQARLCRLKGIQPNPVNDDIVDYCLSTLCNLANQKGAVEYFTHGNNLSLLVRLAAVMPSTGTQCKLYRLLCNLCQASDLVQVTLADLGIINIALRTLKRTGDSYDSPANQSAIISAASLLGNLMADCEANKDMLHEENGISVLLPLVSDQVPVHARTAVLKALRIFIGQGRLSSAPHTNYRPMQERGSSGRGGRTHELGVREIQQELSRLTAGGKESPRRPEGGQSRTVSALYSPSKHAKFESSLPGSLHPDIRRPSARSRSPPGQTRNERSRSKTRVTESGAFYRPANIRSEAEDSLASPRVADPGGGGEASADVSSLLAAGEIKLVNTSEQYKEQSISERYYVRDSVVDFAVDARHEIRTITNVSRISVTTVAEIVCSFLNASGGTIYFGVTSEGRVQGMRVTRDERDRLRMGIGRVMTDSVRPIVRSQRYDIVCAPVVRKLNHEDATLRVPLPNLFVVEIVIKECAHADTIYNTQSGEVFIRKGSKSILANPQEIHTLAVERREAMRQQEIQGLQDDILHLQDLL